MRYFWLLILPFIFSHSLSWAQCTPSLVGPFGDISPDTTVNLPPAPIGVAYSADIQFYVPTDTIAPGFGSVPVVDFTVTSIGGLPTGFTYTTNPSTGVFPGGSSGCAHFQATSPTLAQTGVYHLAVHLTAHVTVLTATVPIKDTIYGYKIVVGTPTGNNEQINPGFNIKQIDSEAGPAQLFFSSPSSLQGMIRVYNILGKEVYSKQISIDQGSSTITLPLAFDPGIYLFEFSDGVLRKSGKILIPCN